MNGLGVDGFKCLTQKWWSEFVDQGFPDFSVCQLAQSAKEQAQGME